MTTPITQEIRDAIVKNRGGFQTATDDQIMTFWHGLSDKVKKLYLQEIDKNATSVQPEKKSPNCSGK